MTSKALRVRLSEVAESIDYGHTSSATAQPIGPKFLRITDIQCNNVNWDAVPYCKCTVAEQSRSALRPGDIVFARTGATTGKSYLLRQCPANAIFASYLIRVRPNPLVIPEYLAHFFQTDDYWRQVSRHSTGTAQAGVNASSLGLLEVPLPPITEQRRIAAILDQADALRAKRRAALSRLDVLAQSIFLEMFGDPISNPKAWPSGSFSEVADCKLGKMLDAKQQTGSYSKLYLRNANVQWHRFDLSDVYEMDIPPGQRERYRLEPGDLLICEGGQPGRAAVWRGELSECYFQKALHRCRAKASIVCVEYLEYLLYCLVSGGGLAERITVATIAHLTAETLASLRVPIPPLSLQKDFAERINKLLSSRRSMEAALAASDRLTQSLHHSAFN